MSCTEALEMVLYFIEFDRDQYTEALRRKHGSGDCRSHYDQPPSKTTIWTGNISS